MKILILAASILFSTTSFASFPSGYFEGMGTISGVPCSTLAFMITSDGQHFVIEGYGKNSDGVNVPGGLMCNSMNPDYGNFAMQYAPINAQVNGNQVIENGQVIGSISDDSFWLNSGNIKANITNGVIYFQDTTGMAIYATLRPFQP